MTKKIKSDGSNSTYYDIPEGARDIGDLIEYRNMSFSVGNIFKACFRFGLKDGIDEEYDLKKIIYFAERELEYVKLRRQRKETKTSEESYSKRPWYHEVSPTCDP